MAKIPVETEHMDVVYIEVPKGSDFSESNPGLHKLYVETAARHLGIVDKMMRRLDKESNLNTTDFINALHLVRESKVKHDAAYRDADRIIRSMKGEQLDPESEGD